MVDLITAEDFQTSLVELLEENLPEFKDNISYDFVEKPTASYIWIDVRPQKKSWDKVYFQRILQIEIQVILLPDEFGRIKHSELWKIIDKLDSAIMPCLKIKGRFITVQDFNSYIVDDILHYEFALDFTDYVKNSEHEGFGYDFMRDLEIQFEDWKLFEGDDFNG